MLFLQRHCENYFEALTCVIRASEVTQMRLKQAHSARMNKNCYRSNWKNHTVKNVFNEHKVEVLSLHRHCESWFQALTCMIRPSEVTGMHQKQAFFARINRNCNESN